MKKKILLLTAFSSFLFSSTTSFGEIAGLRELYGVIQCYNCNRADYERNGNSYGFRAIYKAGKGKSPSGLFMTCSAKQKQYGCSDLLENSSNIIKINGTPQVQSGAKAGGSSGIVGYTQQYEHNSLRMLKSSEDIYFSMSLLRDKNQVSGNRVDLNRQGLAAAELGKWNYLWALYDTYGLSPYYYRYKVQSSEDDGHDGFAWEAHRFKLTDDWNKYVKVEAYIEDYPGSNNYITNPKFVSGKDYKFTSLQTSQSVNDYFPYDEKYAPEVVATKNYLGDGTPWNTWNTTVQRATANFAVQTMPYCKQRVLYKIEVKRIQIPGKWMDYTIFDTYKSLPGGACSRLSQLKRGQKGYNELKKGDTWWGYFDGIYTCTGDTWWWNGGWSQGASSNITKDELHTNSDLFYFYVIQDAWEGDKKFERDCLPTPIANITSAFVNSKGGGSNNTTFSYKNPTDATDIYTYLDGEDAYIKIDFNNEENVFKPSTNPFTSDNTRYISLDIAESRKISAQNPAWKYYVQKDCTDFNNKNCKYVQLAYQYDLNDISVFNSGSNGILYKDMCKFANQKVKEQIGNSANICNPDDPARQNEIFFKYNNAILEFDKISTNANDKNRREFKLRFYPSINSIASTGLEIKHSPITVRPRYFEAKQESCDIGVNCTKPIQANITNGTIYDNKIYADKYLLKVDYPGTTYYFNLAKNYDIVNDSNPIVLTKNNNNNDGFRPIIPFDSANIASIVLKDAHIKKYLQDYFKNPSYDYTKHCSDSDEVLTMDKANIRDSVTGKIACQTPMKNFIPVTPKGVESAISYKDSIDKDARVNVVLNNIDPDNKNFTFAYRIYPQLQAQASNFNKQNIAKYYTDDINIEITPSFSSGVSLDKFVLEQDTNALNRAYANEIKLENGVFKIKVSKEELNKYFKTKLDELNDNTKTTFTFLNEASNMSYDNVSRYEAIVKKDKRINSLIIANENANEIPFTFYYTKKAPIFTLNNVKIKVLKNTQLANDIEQTQSVGVKFVSASPFFKDVKVSKGSDNASIDETHLDIKPMLNYLDSDKQYKEFIYQAKTSKEEAWSADCANANKVCYRKLPSSKLPGYEAKFLSDYGLDITSGTNVLKIKNTKQKNSAYIKDTIHCFGGEFNCDTSFTIEFKND